MSADVDIDFADRDTILELIKHVPARKAGNQVTAGKRHNSGIYVSDIPYDPENECSSIDYKKADSRGYFKIDFLNMSVYKNIKDQSHYDRILQQDVPWDRLLDKTFCEKIMHIGNYHTLITELTPDSIPRMAMFLALIRPAKKHLIGKKWAQIAETIWEHPVSNEYFFKKSHAISYAMLVSLHMRLENEKF